MTNLRISESLSLPIESATWVLAYLAKRGAGKTYCAAVQAEEMLKAGIPIVVLDGMGIWFGLRVSKDGQSDGLPIVVFGGEHQDLPLNPEKGQQMARAIVESNISCVLDLSELSKGQSKKIVASFLDELYHLNRAERHVFIEEADMYAPQKPFGDESVCLGSVDNFVRRGGNHNLGCTLITQRSAVLNKNILTQSDCLVVLRTLAPQDKKAIQLWVEEQTDEDKKELNKWYDTLKELDNGEAWIWHPEKPKIFEKVKFRQRETFHATREFIKTPRAGSIKLMDVGDFISKFKTVFDSAKIEKKDIQGKDSSRTEKRIIELETQLQEITESHTKVQRDNTELRTENHQLKSDLESVKPMMDFFNHLIEQKVNKRDAEASRLSEERLVDDRTPRANIKLWIDNPHIPEPARRVLEVFSKSPSGVIFTRSQLAVECKYSPTSSSVNTGISYLAKNGLVTETSAGVKLNGE